MTQKLDIYNHSSIFDKWKDQITDKYLEEGLSKENSRLFVDYFIDLSKKKSVGYVNRNRSKVKSIFLGLQGKGIKDISKAKREDIENYFFDWCKTKNHSPDYAQRWNAFWNWWKTENRRKGLIVQDLALTLNDFKNKKVESDFVWVTKEEFDNLRKYFDEDKQTILLFCFDSIIRSPTELLSLKVENIFEKNDEVWINIPTEISKTIGRKFNLVYSGEAILEYIKRNELRSEDYLFKISPGLFNKEMQAIAKQLWGDKKSEGGELYKNISLYDLRHSGAIHLRQLFQKTGQSLDVLRERGGWSDFKMINYYTKRLGLDGHISKEKLLLEEDKTKLEKKVDKLERSDKKIAEGLKVFLEIIKSNPSTIKNLAKKDQEKLIELFGPSK